MPTPVVLLLCTKPPNLHRPRQGSSAKASRFFMYTSLITSLKSGKRRVCSFLLVYPPHPIQPTSPIVPCIRLNGCSNFVPPLLILCNHKKVTRYHLYRSKRERERKDCHA